MDLKYSNGSKSIELYLLQAASVVAPRPSSPRAICLGCLLHTLKISYRCRHPSKGKGKSKQVESWRLASQSIGERSFCEERQRSHSAGHANHFGDEGLEINGSVRPGPEMCFEVSEAFSVNLNLATHFKMHSSFRRIYIFRERERERRGGGGAVDGYWLFPEGFRDGVGDKVIWF
ncbi:hypothetical protein CDAR_306131 [Caerostris darwini]|uniref:Uncharacterized protein n=1 Tax=Caerostris darwini TaxID=1538125 RepID=A0AAV4VMS9_9ARAC|nr:hypothetical protein CDAR_306131 [Caerostris darwini]